MEFKLDRIHIRDILVRCIVGINPDEREKKQDIIISLCLEGDLRLPGESDDINDTINYKEIKNRVISFTEESSFYLIEALAHEIAALCLEVPEVRRVGVTIDKPGALRFARSVAVEIFRTREDYPDRGFDG
ncbi:dihydroneopterin aldolase [Marispirochaeta sp.]|jgi:D-erythro-7,8-dihydroneopterin triphosphate epimerase|uniref:dihydroneopterin aldolase n=1 Tax=Marispirochaeta sp. TaxID=2038653 RepID=UPI0029C6E16E|nr:dihydroneopterin aldolase [Marispirochaeta sp.]